MIAMEAAAQVSRARAAGRGAPFVILLRGIGEPLGRNGYAGLTRSNWSRLGLLLQRPFLAELQSRRFCAGFIFRANRTQHCSKELGDGILSDWWKIVRFRPGRTAWIEKVQESGD